VIPGTPPRRAGGPAEMEGRPVSAPDSRTDLRDRIAVGAIFFINGVVLGNWVARIPQIKDQIDAKAGAFGLALLGLAVGNLLSKQVAGRLVNVFGTVPVTRAAVLLTCAMLLVPALAQDAWSLGLALTVFGAALGVLDVAMNVHGVAAQERAERSVMSSFHGLFSLGGLAGVLAGGAAAGTSPRLHFALVALVCGCAGLLAAGSLRRAGAGAPHEPDTAGARVTRPGRLGRQARVPVLLLGVVGLCGMIGEGASGDWSAIYMRDDLSAGATAAGLGFAAYSAGMTVGRLVGDWFIGRWGGVRVVTWSMMAAGGGFGVALAAGHPVTAVAGFAVLGLGLSTVMPVVFSLAGRLGRDRSGTAISTVSMISGTGFLGGPPMIGLTADAVGLPVALTLISMLAFAGAALIHTVGSAEREPTNV
jgi:MFS family permease